MGKNDTDHASRREHPPALDTRHVEPADGHCCDSAAEVARLRAVMVEIQRWTIDGLRQAS